MITKNSITLNIYKSIKSIFIFYISLFLITGCSTFYKVEPDEIKKIDQSDVVQIVFKNGEKLKIKNIYKINYNKNIEFISYSDIVNKTDSTSAVYSLESIKEIRVENIDPQKTVFSIIWITIGVITSLLIIYTLSGGEKISVTG